MRGGKTQPSGMREGRREREVLWATSCQKNVRARSEIQFSFQLHSEHVVSCCLLSFSLVDSATKLISYFIPSRYTYKIVPSPVYTCSSAQSSRIHHDFGEQISWHPSRNHEEREKREIVHFRTLWLSEESNFILLALYPHHHHPFSTSLIKQQLQLSSYPCPAHERAPGYLLLYQIKGS